VDDALAFIEAQDERWFCWLAFNAPHTPFQAPPDELHDVDLPDVEDPGDDPVPFFNAMVEALDTELGRLFASMDPEVLANTTVIFVADNGTTGDVVLDPYDPLRSKGTVYQNGVRVPLIVSGPGVLLPGRRESAPVDVTDLFATSLELLGVNAWPQLLPTETAIDSVSLLPYLLNPFAPAQRDFVFSEVHAPVAIPGVITASFDGGLIAGAQADQSQAYRDGAFKLVRQSNGSLELYNLLADPLESNDLLFPPFLTSEFAAAKARELSRKLNALTGGE
jgi:arylsulfatase A-like enzyme